MVAFVYGPHAADMLMERDIDPAWVERTVVTPDSLDIDPNHPAHSRAFRTIPERDGRVLRVDYERIGDTVRIITLVSGPRPEAARMKSKYDPETDALYLISVSPMRRWWNQKRCTPA